MRGRSNGHVINAWIKSGEACFEKSVHPHAGASEAQTEMNRELVKDLVEWFDSTDGRAFIAHAFPETKAVIFPRQPLETDPAYFIHLTAVDAMYPKKGMASMPKRTPIVFLSLGFVTGILTCAALAALVF